MPQPPAPARPLSTVRVIFQTLFLLVCGHFILALLGFRYPDVALFKRFQGDDGVDATALQQGILQEDRPATSSNDGPSSTQPPPPASTPIAPPPRRANATIMMLVRNHEVNKAVSSIQQLEDRFNRKFNYPWVFLNDEEFTEEFINRTRILISGDVSYGVIPPTHWHQPEWIDETKATAAREELVKSGVLYGGSVSYRNMCRFNSGFFYQHELMQQYRYYWRVEPDVSYYCDIDYDPFLFMQDNDKVYGFTVTLYEGYQTVPSLWDGVKEFINEHPEYLVKNNSMRFLSHNRGKSYDLCHFWSNFEIADMELWRGEAYSAFFEHLDRLGGFYYERWGDAPVHSIGAGLFARRDQIHFFDDIGYRHDSFTHCPQGDLHTAGRCSCDPKNNFDRTGNSCLRRWKKVLEYNI